MIAIELQLLTGRYVATSFNDRRAPEWPPHPARLFSALVSTASEHDQLDAETRGALQWLEAQGPPRVLASKASKRAAPDIYVPENTPSILDDWSKQEEELREAERALAQAEREEDTKAAQRARKSVDKARKKLDARVAKAVADDGKHTSAACAEAEQMFPARRGRQPRTLPSVTPEQPHVRYVWRSAQPDGQTERVLSDLAARVVRLGHSSTLVACRVLPDDAASHEPDDLGVWEPTQDGPETLRTVGPGQLTALEHAHARHQGIEPRLLPARHNRYVRMSRGDVGATELPRPVLGDGWHVLREVPGDEHGRRLGLQATRTEDITRAVRGALLHHAEDPPPAVLSGHTPDGRPLEGPHAAFVALPDVLSGYSSGAMLGVAVVLPRNIDNADQQAVLRALGRWEQSGLRLTLGRTGAMQLERVVDHDPRRTLDPHTWTHPAHRWASVTPIALDENPGQLDARDPAAADEAAERAEELVARSCERIGLPRPQWVQLMRRSLFAAPAARRFMPFPRGNGKGLRRVCVHVEIRFEQPVAGPILLGAGRYFGIGLCAPRWEEG